MIVQLYLFSTTLKVCIFFSQWEGGRVVELGWTTSENLVCVLEDGSMIVYDINGQLLYSRIIQRVRVVKCHLVYLLRSKGHKKNRFRCGISAY